MAGAVKRINEVMDPLLLGEGEVQEMINMVLDDAGSGGIPVRRGSWRNSSLPSLPSEISGLFSLKPASGGESLAAIAGGRLYVSKEGKEAWVEVCSGLEHSEFCGALDTGGGRSLIFSGFSNRVAGGTDFEEVTPLAIEPPVISGDAPVSAVQHDTGGSISNGWYNYVLIYESVEGDFSSPSQPFTAYRSHTTGSTGFSGSTNRVEISNLPVPSDPRVIRKKLFRTKAVNASSLSGSPFIYYELAVLSPDEVNYTDKSNDDDLSSWRIAKFTSPPSGLSFCFNRGRLFTGNLKIQEINYYEPPFSNDGAGIRVFSGAGVITGGEIWNASGYRYRIVYVDANGTPSRNIETPLILTPGEEFENMASISLNYIPFLPSRESTRIIEKRLYRTKKDGGTFLRHPVKLTLNQVSFTDTLADDGLGSETFYDSVKITHFPSTLAFSEPGNYFSFLPENVISLPQGSNSGIISIFDDVDGILIFSGTSISKLYTTGDPVTWRVVTLNNEIGIPDKNSVLRTGNGIWFRSNGSLRRYSGGEISSPGEMLLKTWSQVESFYRPVWLSERGWCCFPVKMKDGSAMLLIFDEKFGSWYKFTHPGLKGVATFEGGAGGLLLAWKGGMICEYRSLLFASDIIGELDTEVEVELTSRAFSYQGLDLMRARMLRIYFESLPGELAVTLQNDSGELTTGYSLTEESELIKITPVSQMTGAGEYCRRIAVKIKGTGIKILRMIKLETRRVRA